MELLPEMSCPTSAHHPALPPSVSSSDRVSLSSVGPAFAATEPHQGATWAALAVVTTTVSNHRTRSALIRYLYHGSAVRLFCLIRRTPVTHPRELAGLESTGA